MARASIAVAACAFLFLPGCITLFSKTEVVRGDESRRPVRFENQEAAETFQKNFKKADREVGSTYVGVPFVTLYSRGRTLSEAAAWNDAVSRCDTDQDGLITVVEATVFVGDKD